MANQATPQIQAEALTIIELEERFELTAAAADTDKCSGNDVEVDVKVK
jgi:hypothetical protein